jgi:hypothetical protein
VVARDARSAQIVRRTRETLWALEDAVEILSVAMKDHSAMTQILNLNAASTACSAARCSSIRDRILLAMVLYAMVRAGEALAGDQAASADSKLLPDARAEGRQSPTTLLPSASPVPAAAPLPTLSSLPPSLFSTDRSIAPGEGFSATEFRPRRHSLSAAESAAGEGFGQDAPMLQGTTVWQRMAEYKSQDRVRVLTLFETRSSTLSLQAGKRFGPSLQWSSRGMNHDGATRGLLDRLVFAALRATPSSPRPGPSRTIAAPATVKPANLPAAAGAQ